MEEIQGWTKEWHSVRKPHKKLYFTVTADDIARGKVKGCGGKCPVERAVSRELGLDITMGLTCFVVAGKKHQYRNNTVESDLACFVSSFDNHDKVEPGKFYIEVPEEFE